MKALCILILSLSVSLTSSLVGNAQSSDIEISFTPINSYATQENGVFFSSDLYPLSMASDQQNNVYIFDKGLNRLMSFDEKGELLWQTGQNGRGPGDFDRASGMTLIDNYLYITNMNGSRIDQYTLNGQYSRSFNLDGLGSLIRIEGYIAPNNIIATSTAWGILGNDILVLELVDDEVKLKSKFQVNFAPEINLGKRLSSASDVVIIDSHIVTGNRASYNIGFYDLSGKKVKNVSKDFDKVIRPGFYNSERSRAINDFGGGVTPLRKLSENYFISSIAWATNVPDPDEYVSSRSTKRVIYKNSIDVFDKEGNLVYSKEYDGRYNPEIGSIIYIDPQGYVYARKSSREPQLTKYRVSISD